MHDNGLVVPNFYIQTISTFASILFAAVLLPACAATQVKEIESSREPATIDRKVDTSKVKECGSSQATIDDRIKDCGISWDGTTSGYGKWSLVTKITRNVEHNEVINHEVWLDRLTKVLWSSMNERVGNWCRASGSTGFSYKGHNCTPGGEYQSAPPISVCSDKAGDGTAHQPTAGSFKGNMHLEASPSSPSVRWTIPNLDDFRAAYDHGADYVIPEFSKKYGFWSNEEGLLYHGFRRNPYRYGAPLGYLAHIRCAGD